MHLLAIGETWVRVHLRTSGRYTRSRVCPLLVEQLVGKAAGEYYFDSPVGPDSATFVLKPGATLHEVFAAEVSRFCSAAIETARQIDQFADLPQSTGWLLIRMYYAAFFAGHGILRMSGVCCTQFDGHHCAKADEIADALGLLSSPLKSGSYRCEYDVTGAKVICTRRPSSKGVHEDFWRVLQIYLTGAADSILTNALLPAEEAQTYFNQVNSLRDVLMAKGCNGGNWLSVIRNQVNYAHTFKAWFPYRTKRSYSDDLFNTRLSWQKPPDQISLSTADDLKKFLLACSLLISLCKAMVEDMARRSAGGRSFLEATTMRLLR